MKGRATDMAGGMSRLLPIDGVDIGDLERAGAVRLNARIQASVELRQFLLRLHRISQLRLTPATAYNQITLACNENRTELVPIGIKFKSRERERGERKT